MARPLRIQYPGAFYHVTSRGNECKDIFLSTIDRERFLGYLESATCRYGAVIHAYCLLSNHYHLLLETPTGNLSAIMRHINGAYTTYFNTKRKRAGHLFQGRYKAILVEADAYAAELSRYIHLNPLRAGMVETLEDYRWSSYPVYIGLVEPTPWLRTDFILSLLSRDPHAAQRAYRDFVEEGRTTVDESPLNKVVVSTILGGGTFVQEALARYKEEVPSGQRPAAIKKLTARPSIDKVLATVDAELGGQDKLARKIAIYLCRQLTGATLKQIGKRFGLKESAVSQACRRLANQLIDDKTLATLVARLEKSLIPRAKHSARGETDMKNDRASSGETGHLLGDINTVLKDFPEVRFCTLFGSAGQGRLTARSDVDVAVAGEQRLRVETRARLATALSVALGREVDLVDLQDVAGLILEQALCRAKVVKNADHSLYAQLLKRLWYNQADMMPYVKRVLEERNGRWLR
jgi:REP element-mobilizing transposase RayT/predicted nucleotidyltransferase